MNYQKTLDFLFSQLPMYQRVGKQAYKKDLGNIKLLCQQLNNPQNSFRSIHIAGTNGKGSTAHILASMLQTAGYRVGLYTSPHYVDFRERIKINGTYISKKAVVEFVASNKQFFSKIKPSFFEMTVAMAFDYFNYKNVDIAIIETGLGGRLDSTNIIKPVFSIVTNIGMDHESMLGDTLEKIANEKAGIIKSGIPVIIGERDPETDHVFIKKAKKEKAEINFVQDVIQSRLLRTSMNKAVYSTKSDSHPFLNLEELTLDLTGNYQKHNLNNALVAAQLLKKADFKISEKHIRKACSTVQETTKIKGRWQIINESPLTICDSGHNVDGLRYIVKALKEINKRRLHFVFGSVNDKDLNKILPLLPKDALYYFCRANIPRGLDADELMRVARSFQLYGQSYISVNEALNVATKEARKDDCIFIGGSIFVVAEVV